MTLRRYSELKSSAGTQWPADVKAAIYMRDQGCVGPRVGMPGDCFGPAFPDHVRASHGIGIKSASTTSNGALLCSPHHRLKTENGKAWRPKLIDWIDADPHAAHVDPCGDPACPAAVRRA